MKKKILAVIAVLAVSTMLAGCKSNEKVITATTTVASSIVSTTVATTTTAPIETTTEAEPTETEPIETEPVTTEPVATEPITTEAIEETEPVETTEAPVATTEPIEETTKPVETTAKPEWVETEYSATLYTNTACNAREEAIQGTAVVKTYAINTKVTIVAKTDTGYYKLADGTFIHGDYLSKSKTEETKPAQTTAKPAETTKPAGSGTTSYDNAVDVVGMENYIPGYIYSEDWEAFFNGGYRNDGVYQSGGIRVYKENFVVGKDIPAGWYWADALSSGENGGTGILVSVKTSAGVEKFSLWYGFNTPDSQVMTPFYCADGDVVTGTCCIVPFIRNGYITSYEHNGNKHQFFLVGEGNELEAGTYKLEEDAATCQLKPKHIGYGAYIVRNGEFLYIHQVVGKWVDATSDTITVQSGDFVRLENMKIDY